MKCAVAIVLALVGLVAANPVPPLGLGIGAPVYFRSTVVNHGIPVSVAPVVKSVITAPVITSVAAPIGLGWGGWGGLGGWGGHGGWGGYGDMSGHGGWGGYGTGWGGH